MSELPNIPGDFLSLLANQRLTPLKLESLESAPVETQATTVFALQFDGGVLMAGDRRATAGNNIVTETVDKVLEVDAISLLGIAGVPATAFEMARVLQSSFEYYRRSQLQQLSLSAKVRSLARLLRENMPMTMQGVGVVTPIFAGLEGARGARSSQPQIYFYDPLGAQFHAVSYAASGSGSNTIRSILSYQQRFGNPRPDTMEMKRAVQFALRLLNIAAEFDSATGGVNPETNHHATIKILDENGVKSVTPEQQAECYNL